jgi:hypothetical protein
MSAPLYIVSSAVTARSARRAARSGVASTGTSRSDAPASFHAGRESAAGRKPIHGLVRRSARAYGPASWTRLTCAADRALVKKSDEAQAGVRVSLRDYPPRGNDGPRGRGAGFSPEAPVGIAAATGRRVRVEPEFASARVPGRGSLCGPRCCRRRTKRVRLRVWPSAHRPADHSGCRRRSRRQNDSSHAGCTRRQGTWRRSRVMRTVAAPQIRPLPTWVGRILRRAGAALRSRRRACGGSSARCAVPKAHGRWAAPRNRCAARA